MSKQQTYTIKLDAEIASVNTKFEALKKQLTAIGAIGKFPDLDKALTSIGNKIGKIKEHASQPASGAVFRQLSKDTATTNAQLEGLVDIFKDLTRNLEKTSLEILPKEEADKIRSITRAVEDYSTAIQQSTQKTKEHLDAEKSLDKARKSLSEWQGKLSDNTQALESTREQKKAIEENLNKTKESIEAKKAEIALQEEYIKKLEEAYKTQGVSRTKKITVDGKETSLQRERNKKKKSEAELAGLESTRGGLQTSLQETNKQIKTYSEAIVDCNTKITTYENSVTRCTQAVQAFNEEMAKSSITKQKQAYDALREAASELGIEIDDITTEDTEENVEQLKNRLIELKNQGFKGVSEGVNEAVDATEEMKKAVGELDEGVEKNNETWKENTEATAKADAIKDRIKDFVGMAGAAKVLQSALRNAYATIKELDAAMAEIAVVTDFSVGDMWEQLPQYTKSANDLGVAIHSVYEASALYYQQGLDTNQVTAMSTETLKLMKIAGLDAEEATNRMTAALRGFNMELNEVNAQRVSDVYSQLAAITASDVDEISTAMTKTASIAKSAGMEFETTAAFLSQIIETTRESAETAGTAMKTVVARFQELKKDPSEIGEVEGEIVDANAIETALRSVGVALRDSSGQFRELDDVFLELSAKWDSLDKNTQRYIATIAAGSRQQSRFIAMMSNNARTTELVAAANASVGASNKQFEKTLETLESKLQRLENAWDEFAMGIMNSGWVKAAIDGLTSVVNGVNRVTTVFGDGESAILDWGNTFNGIFNSFTKIGLLIAAFNLAKKAFEKFSKYIGEKTKQWGRDIGENIAKGVENGLKKSQIVVDKATKKKKPRKGMKKGDANNPDTLIPDVEDKQIKGLEKFNKAMHTTGTVTVLAGAGLGVVSELLNNLGAEEAANAVSVFGSVLSVAGSVTSIVGVLTNDLTIKLLKQAGAWIAAHAAMMAWVAVGLVIIGILIWLASASSEAEKKLESSTEAYDRASEAADTASKAYNNLKTSLDELGTRYDVLDNLTEGTKEWNEAVMQANQSVLDLIDKYPELARFVSNKSGVLRLDTESAEVQEVLNKKQQGAILAQNMQSKAKANLSMAQLDVNIEKSDLFDETEKYGLGGLYERSNSARIEDVKKWAKQYATGNLSEAELQELSGASNEAVAELKRFGEQLVAAEAQMDLTYSSIASSAVSTLSEKMNEQEFARAEGLTQQLTSFIREEAERQSKSYKVDGKNVGLDDKQHQVIQRAVKAQYGEGATIDDNGFVTYYDEAGKRQEVELYDEDIQAMAATQLAYEKSLEIAEATETLYKSLSDIEGIGEETADNIAKGYKELTQDDISKIKSQSWDDLSQELREAAETIYGSAEEFEKAMKDSAKQAEKAFAKSKDINKYIQVGTEGFWSNLSSGAAEGLSKQLQEVFYQTGTNGAQMVEKAFAVISGDKNVTQEEFEKIVARYNSINIDNQKDLLTAQEEIIRAYGVTEDAAQQLTKTIMEQNHNFDELSTTISSLTGVVEALNQIEISSKKASDAMWKMEQAEDEGSTSARKEAEKEYLDALSIGEQLKSGRENAAGNLEKFYGLAANYTNEDGKSYNLLQYYDIDEKGNMTIKKGMEQEVFEKEFTDQGFSDAVEQFKSKLDEQKSNFDTMEDVAKENLEAMKDLRDSYKESYNDLRERAISAVAENLQEQIDIQQELLDIERDSFGQLIAKAQEQIDSQRQARENEETQKAIEDSRNQLALMQMTTSGAGSLEAKELEQSIAQQEQDYQDSLIDQTLQQLQDANEKAFEQREKQIDLQQQSLDSYTQSQEFQAHIDTMMTDLLQGGTNSQLYNILYQAETQGKSEAQKIEWAKNLEQTMDNANAYVSNELKSRISELAGYIGTIQTTLVSMEKGRVAGLAAADSGLAKKGFGENFASSVLGASSATDSSVIHAQRLAAKDAEEDVGRYNDLIEKYNQDKTPDREIMNSSQYYANLAEMGLTEESKSFGEWFIEQNEKHNITGEVLLNNYAGGAQVLDMNGEDFATLKAAYKDKTKFQNALKQKQVITGVHVGQMSDMDWDHVDKGEAESGSFELDGTTYNFETFAKKPDDSLGNVINAFPNTESIFMDWENVDTEGWIRVSRGGKTVGIKRDGGVRLSDLFKSYKFQSGGLADFTGPAWLDGTKSRPEYVLNAEQTQRFFSLIDVLEGFDKNNNSNVHSGDNYIDVDINVEKIDSDYDVDQLAKRVRTLIYDDATYRNVNAVSHTR